MVWPMRSPLVRSPLLIALSVLGLLTACGEGAVDGGVGTSDVARLAEPDTAAANPDPTSARSPADPEPITIVAAPTEVAVDPVELALATGDASVVPDARALEDALVAAIDDAATRHVPAIAEILALNPDGTARSDGSSLTAIDWDPTHDAALLEHEPGENAALLRTNGVSREGYETRSETLAVVGESSARYLVMGGNPMRNHRRDAAALNEAMHRVLENGIGWLTRRDDLDTAPFSIVAAQLEQSHYFPDELGVREWLGERFGGRALHNEPDACDGDALSTCLAADPDLLIVSGHLNEGDETEVVASAVAEAMTRGVPVLYLHLDGHASALSEALFPLFDVRHAGDNYWRRLLLAGHDPRATLGVPSAEMAAVRRLVEHFRANDFAIDWDDCDGEDCRANESLERAFQDGASHVKSLMQALDRDKVNLFAHPERYRFKKLLALLGDRYRTEARFPMDRKATPTTEFLRALYADHATYQFRDVVGRWADLGNFARDDYSHVTPVTRTVRQLSRRHFRATGAYALPGRTVTMTRHDDAEVGVRVRVNSLRDGSTRLYADFGYARPRVLRTPSIAIESGETLRFTSATGGPLQLEYDANGQDVAITFENVGEHAYWRDAADDERFASALAADELDWAEIAAPSFEVHSTREKMLASLSDRVVVAGGGTPRALVDATMRYVHDLPHVLAGFRGPGVSVVEEIHRFAADNGLPVDELDLVKHMNADQASCGYGCSGNPYDAYWSFSPIGHGDLHELGHGLERARFRFSGWPGHAITNFYSYYAKTRYFEDTGDDPDCQSLPFRSIFEVLRASVAEPDPGAHVRAALWNDTSWSEGAAAMIQMMMAAEDAGALEDGWHLLARLHLIEREYQRAIRDDAAWLASREGLGMSLYARADARALGAEDWLLIALSHASGFDFRDWFDAWGHRYADDAAAQVASMTLPPMPVAFYVASGDGFCRGEGFDGRKIALDGVASWPTDD